VIYFNLKMAPFEVKELFLISIFSKAECKNSKYCKIAVKGEMKTGMDFVLSTKSISL
jgi:hypothetical protein